MFNTVASAGMKILNALSALPLARYAPHPDCAASHTAGIRTEGMSVLVRLLSPITPHISHHLWRELSFGESVLDAPWPEPDPAP